MFICMTFIDRIHMKYLISMTTMLLLLVSVVMTSTAVTAANAVSPQHGINVHVIAPNTKVGIGPVPHKAIAVTHIPSISPLRVKHPVFRVHHLNPVLPVHHLNPVLPVHHLNPVLPVHHFIYNNKIVHHTIIVQQQPVITVDGQTITISNCQIVNNGLQVLCDIS